MLKIEARISGEYVYDIVDYYAHALEEMVLSRKEYFRAVTREEQDAAYKQYNEDLRWFHWQEDKFEALRRLTPITRKTAFDFVRIAGRLRLFESGDWVQMSCDSMTAEYILGKLIEQQEGEECSDLD